MYKPEKQISFISETIKCITLHEAIQMNNTRVSSFQTKNRYENMTK